MPYCFTYKVFIWLVACHHRNYACYHLPTRGRAGIKLGYVDTCKARYAVLFKIWTLSSIPEDEAHIGPTATYDEVVYPGFQHDVTTLQIQGYNISYKRHTSA